MHASMTQLIASLGNKIKRHQHIDQKMLLKGQAAAANWTLEIGLSGMRGRGLAETCIKVELGTRRTTERVSVGNSPPKVACAVILPDRHKE